ncbi:stage V sporulation protein S [Clostridium sp.]|uniref:stage V sporulation protein S n=1 Tax=Clostridium sp. TaxID=1506 RepID=UPI001A4F67FC|nr:stage V sporulation protein S [Clostridium sp.]MBK5241918.1 stage V sporulation protein S [Clostridium sp.]
MEISNEITSISSMNNRQTYVSKVGSKTDPIRLATSIQLSLKAGKNVQIMAMGKEAIFTASKAVCISQGFAEQNGLELHWKPSYKTVIGNEDGQPRSVMSWLTWVVD